MIPRQLVVYGNVLSYEHRRLTLNDSLHLGWDCIWINARKTGQEKGLPWRFRVPCRHYTPLSAVPPPKKAQKGPLPKLSDPEETALLSLACCAAFSLLTRQATRQWNRKLRAKATTQAGSKRRWNVPRTDKSLSPRSESWNGRVVNLSHHNAFVDHYGSNRRPPFYDHSPGASNRIGAKLLYVAVLISNFIM